MADDRYLIGVYLTKEQSETFDRIKAHYGIERNSDAIRLLIQRVARDLDRLAVSESHPPASP